jgi:hypothetical protein
VVEVRRKGAGPAPAISQSRTGVQHLTETPEQPIVAAKPAPKWRCEAIYVDRAPRKNDSSAHYTAFAAGDYLQHRIAPNSISPGLFVRPAPPARAATKQMATAKPKPLPSPVAASPASPAKQNRDGGRSLTRALGLKVGGSCSTNGPRRTRHRNHRSGRRSGKGPGP